MEISLEECILFIILMDNLNDVAQIGSDRLLNMYTLLFTTNSLLLF